MDQETCENFSIAEVRLNRAMSHFHADRKLAKEFERHAQATISRSLEENNKHFQEAREKLEKWATTWSLR